MQVIPAIDLWEGKAVRLRQGDFSRQEIVGEDIYAVGERFLEWGLRRWHIVDLMGAREGRLLQRELLARLRAAFPEVRVSVGGGIRTEEEVEWVLSQGFGWVVIGSMAVEEPERVQDWIKAWGPDRFILAADVREGHIAVKGWQVRSSLPLDEFLAQWRMKGIAGFLCTQVERDGLLQGTDEKWYAEVQRVAAPVPVIASGGIRGRIDLDRLARVGISAAIVGKALYADPTVADWIGAYVS